VLGNVVIFPASAGAINSLTGLSQLTSVGGQLWINDNSALTTFQGLHNVTSVGSHLRVRYNSNVLSLAGLDKIATVGGELDISNNQKLQSMTGLNALASVGSNCILSNNGHLVSLAALITLKSIGGYLAITVDSSLNSLAGIDSISHTSITNLQIVNSKKLYKCNVKSVCDYLAIGTSPLSAATPSAAIPARRWRTTAPPRPASAKRMRWMWRCSPIRQPAFWW
jgi:hypothetical protein